MSIWLEVVIVLMFVVSYLKRSASMETLSLTQIMESITSLAGILALASGC